LPKSHGKEIRFLFPLLMFRLCLSILSLSLLNPRFPPHDDYTREHLGAFFAGPANSEKNAHKVPKILEELKKYAPNITTWGILGVSSPMEWD
jgi:hypothetical protein